MGFKQYPIVRFVRAFAADWITLMSGLASVIMGTLGASFDWGSQRWVFWLFAIACVLVASYRVWSQADLLRAKAERALNDRDTERERRKALGSELSSEYNKGLLLRREICESDDSLPVDTCNDKMKTWSNDLYNLLAKKVSLAKATYVTIVASVTQSFIGGMKSQETRENKNTIVLHIDARLERLAEILKEF